MKNNKTPSIEFNNLNKELLDKEKAYLEIQNLKDAGQSPIEIFMKRRVIPVFLPFLTLMITIVFFYINWRQAEKTKALDRYKSEVDVVKMVWDDMKKMDTSSQEFKTSKKFLIGMFNANISYYRKDSIYLGIGINQRPIMVLTSMNSDIRKAFEKIEKNNQLAEVIENVKTSTQEDSNDKQINNKKTIVTSKSPEVVKATNAVAGNALQVYIQYTQAAGKEKAQFLAYQLKPYYIVPAIDYVGKKEDTNEIRYYNNTQLEKALLLGKRLKDITGLEFTLKNINNTTAKNIIEVWYCNSKPEVVAEAPTLENSLTKETTDIPQVAKQVLFDEDSNISPGFKRQLLPGFIFYVDKFDENTSEAIIRVNNSVPETFKINIMKTITVNNVQITINVKNYKVATVRKAVYFHATIVQ